MRYDIENQLCVAQAFTGGSTVSTHSYQKQTAAQDLSIGRRMALLLQPTVAAGVGSTHTCEAIEATAANLGAGVGVLNTITLLAAVLILGSEHELPIPQGSMTKQFLGFRHSASGGTTTVTLDVYLVPQDEIPKFKTFTKVNDADV